MTNEDGGDASLRGYRDVAATPHRVAARNVIAAIGIDRYCCWPSLQNAVNDARAVRDRFLQLGFVERTESLFDKNATAAAMRRMIDDLRSLDENDSLVVFYAGHGATFPARHDREGDCAGYLIPVNAESTPGRLANWIELDPWLRSLAGLGARHILVILDACRSGIALTPSIQRAHQSSPGIAQPGTHTARRSRLVITSALDDQRALDSGPLRDHSLFTGVLLEGLTRGLPGERDASGRRVIMAADLGRYVQRGVSSRGAPQTPDFGCFHGDERGAMVIPVSAGLALPSRASPRRTALEPASGTLTPGRRTNPLWGNASSQLAVPVSRSVTQRATPAVPQRELGPPASPVVECLQETAINLSASNDRGSTGGLVLVVLAVVLMLGAALSLGVLDRSTGSALLPAVSTRL